MVVTKNLSSQWVDIQRFTRISKDSEGILEGFTKNSPRISQEFMDFQGFQQISDVFQQTSYPPKI